MFPKFSLRAHKSALTCITSHRGNVVSSDRDGWIILWDLPSRRPSALWKAHDGHILTLKSTPIGLMSHGRDSAIRIWNTDSEMIVKCSRSGSDISEAGSEAKSKSDSESKPELAKPPCAEIPVNALNFCNVDFHNGLLITPATGDSDNFDIYEVSDPFGDFNLKRVAQNVSPQDVKKSEYIIEEINVLEGENKRGGHGIIMRTLFVDEKLFFVGYESGAVIGFSIEKSSKDKLVGTDRLVIFNDYKLKVVFSSIDHKPSPVLSLRYDPTCCQLYTGSASKKLLIYEIKHLREHGAGKPNEANMSSHNLRHYGIQCIEIASDIILTGFWDGTIKGFSKDFEEISRLERKEEFLKPETNDALTKTAKKSLCMHVWEPSGKSEPSPSRKISFRKAAVGNERHLFVGYGDGLITAFSGVNLKNK